MRQANSLPGGMTIGDTAEVEMIPGAEGISLMDGKSSGVLLLHGFGDTPQTLRALAAHLHDSGYDVAAPLLPGHGTNMESFMRSRREDWLACARVELARMQSTHSSVALAGLSMGGALAAILAAETPDIPALVLMAPYLNMPPTLKVAAATHWAWGGLAGARKGSNPGSILDPVERARNLGYGVYSGRLLYELWRLAARARRALAKITVPTLLIQSRDDPRIAPTVARDAFSAIRSADKKLVWVEGAGHIITVDYGRAQVFEQVKQWIADHPRAR